MNRNELFAAVDAAGQSQLLRFYDELNDTGKLELESEIAALDFTELRRAIADFVLKKPEAVIPKDLKPAPYFPLVPRSEADRAGYDAAGQRGGDLIRAGRVCCLTVAGGQGTRLGFDGPKGTYPIGPVSGASLFSYFAGAILRSGRKYGVKLSWYIMTSKLNHRDTVEFFEKNRYFGLDPEQLFFFTQGTMPAIGYDGKILLSSKSGIALSPDGHGGTLLALRKSGALDRMRREGTDIISYFQVDNPLVPVVNPLFIGLHDRERSEMSAIMLAKTGPFEKLGNFCESAGRVQIIEYSDLPAELAEKRSASGGLAFVAGSPAIHLLNTDFVERLTADGKLKLPWHRADKKIPCIDAAGRPVKPETPNGVKLESFIFDALPLAARTMILEGDRSLIFAPTKNPTGVDSAESCRAMLIERDARRLAAAGVVIPRDGDGKVEAKIEIAPGAACDAADVADYVKAHRITAIRRGESICFK